MLLVLLALVGAEAKPARCWTGGAMKSMQGQEAATYISAADLDEDERREADLEVRPAKPVAARGGIVMVDLYRTSLDALASGLQAVVVIDAAGRELARREREAGDPIPEAPPPPYYMWWTGHIAAALVDPIAADGWPLQVHVVDRVQDSKCVFTVDERGKVKVLKD